MVGGKVWYQFGAGRSKMGGVMQILVFLGSWAFYTLPRMKYSKLELRAETFRVDSPNGEATFVF